MATKSKKKVEKNVSQRISNYRTYEENTRGQKVYNVTYGGVPYAFHVWWSSPMSEGEDYDSGDWWEVGGYPVNEGSVPKKVRDYIDKKLKDDE